MSARGTALLAKWGFSSKQARAMNEAWEAGLLEPVLDYTGKVLREIGLGFADAYDLAAHGCQGIYAYWYARGGFTGHQAALIEKGAGHDNLFGWPRSRSDAALERLLTLPIPNAYRVNVFRTAMNANEARLTFQKYHRTNQRTDDRAESALREMRDAAATLAALLPAPLLNCPCR